MTSKAREIVARVVAAMPFAIVAVLACAGAAAAAPGDLDRSFAGGAGLWTADVSFGGEPDTAHAVAVQSDGKILVAGSVGDECTDGHRWALARFHPDGTPDTDFGSNGLVIENPPGPSRGFYALAIQPDGKIVAAGGRREGVFWCFALARYTDAGKPDPDFGSAGKVTTLIPPTAGGENSAVYALALQPDGRILAAGVRDVYTPADGAFARYNSDGSLDGDRFEDGHLHFGFSGDGMLVHPFGGPATVRALALQPDGRIVYTGDVGFGSGQSFLVGRLSAIGADDHTFAGDGADLTDFAGGEDSARSVIVQPSGRIVVGGTATMAAGNTDFALAGYDGATGLLDTGFAGGGKGTINFAGGDRLAALLRQADGKLIGVGDMFDGASGDIALARWSDGGGLDDGFGSHGQAQSNFGSRDEGFAAALQPDGRIVVASSVALAARVRTPGRSGVHRDVPLAKRTLTLPAAGTRRLALRRRAAPARLSAGRAPRG
jgi:uncharacterized delta-60 repeat protein